MSIIKQAWIFFGLWMGGLAYASEGLVENDLSSLRLVSIRGEIKTVQNQKTGKVALHLRLPHRYTNSLACSGHISFSVEGSNEERTLEIKDLLIFPDMSFGRPLSFPLPVVLQPGETLSTYFRAERDFICKGWDTQIPLPDGFCKNAVLLPGIAEACGMLAPGVLVPWIRNGAYLGSCRC